MPKFIEAITAFERGAQVFVNNQEMFDFNLVKRTISTSYSIIPIANLASVTIVE